jgi:hypothetical protein
MFNNSVRTAKEAPYFTVTKINRLTLFKEIIAVYSENHKNQKITNEELSTVGTDGVYSYHWALNGTDVQT